MNPPFCFVSSYALHWAHSVYHTSVCLSLSLSDPVYLPSLKIWNILKYWRTPGGVLNLHLQRHPGSARGEKGAHVSAKSPSNISPNPSLIRRHMQSFGTPSQLFKIPPLSTQKMHSAGGRGGPRNVFWGGILIFLLLRTLCKAGQRTHSARTNIL